MFLRRSCDIPSGEVSGGLRQLIFQLEACPYAFSFWVTQNLTHHSPVFSTGVEGLVASGLARDILLLLAELVDSSVTASSIGTVLSWTLLSMTIGPFPQGEGGC